MRLSFIDCWIHASFDYIQHIFVRSLFRNIGRVCLCMFGRACFFLHALELIPPIQSTPYASSMPNRKMLLQCSYLGFISWTIQSIRNDCHEIFSGNIYIFKTECTKKELELIKLENPNVVTQKCDVQCTFSRHQSAEF